MTLTGSGFTISGLATNGPAVKAQYPDADLAPDARGPAPTVSNLGDIVRTQRAAERQAARRDPQAAARRRVAEASVKRRVTAALPGPSGMGVSESGSIPLLMLGIAVLSVGAILRWRRGAAQI